ncbi:MAG: hypothetical protein ABI443_10885 [Chthoniobacterales bacterium]
MNYPRIMRCFYLAAAFAVCLPVICTAGTEKDNAKGSSENGSVRTLMGKIYTGKIEIRNDDTLRITNDSGIAHVSIVELDEPGFKKYGFRKDRSHDGKFWFERKAALGVAMLAINHTPASSSGGGGGGGSPQNLSSNISELGPFQPLIDAYEKSEKPPSAGANTASPNASPGGDTASNTANPSSKTPLKGYYPAGNGPLDVIKPIINAAESTIGVTGSLPSTPSVPTAPSE